MASVHDVAAYILEKKGRMTTMKLQKLTYYAQAWSLVWDEKPLFPEKIEAWASGPVVPKLFSHHKGMFDVASWSEGKSRRLEEVERETVDAVIDFYGDKTSQWLSDLTHAERPWREARKGLSPTDRGSKEITHASMMEYYSSLKQSTE